MQRNPRRRDSIQMRGPAPRLEWKDLAVRFAVGGCTVVLCFVIARLSPWRAFGGMFAAFPAVMVAAVAMSGAKDGQDPAAATALGAVSGMLAGTACVAVCLALVTATHSWKLSLSLAMAAWFGAAGLFSSTVSPFMARRLGRGNSASRPGGSVP